MKLKAIVVIGVFIFLILAPFITARQDWTRPLDYCSGGTCAGSLYIPGNLTVIGDYVNITVVNYNVTGNSHFTGNVSADYFFGIFNGNSSIWSRSGTDVFPTNIGDNIGIGTTSPATALDVNGSCSCTDYYGSGQHLEDIELTKGLVLNMPFQAGNPLKDMSGEGNDGTVTGATWNYTGGYNNLGAYEFDGVDDYINFSDEDSFDFGTSDFSVTFWIKFNDSTAVDIMGNYYDGDEIGWVISFSVPYIGIDLLDNASIDISDSVAISPDDEWHFIAVVVDADGDLSISKDGVYGNGADRSSVGNISNDYDFLIGTVPDGYNANPFNGTIDEVRIYNRSLSAEEIKRLYELKEKEPHFDGSPLYLDHVNDRVGIGTASPTNDLTVVGDINATGNIYVGGCISYNCSGASGCIILGSCI